jgi:DNA-binding transcriptional MocR family regulator
MSAVARSLFSSAEARLIPLGAALPDPAWLPGDALQRALHLRAVVWTRMDRATACLREGGFAKQDCRALCAVGSPFGADDLIITAGATQALRLALGPCASRVMSWRLSSPPTLARSCCWRI